MIALAQAELAHLLHRHVDVVLARQVTLDAQEAVALVTQVEQALDLDGLPLPVLLGLALPTGIPVPVPITIAAPAAAPAIARLAIVTTLLAAVAATAVAATAALPALLLARGCLGARCPGALAVRRARLTRVGVGGGLSRLLRRGLRCRLGLTGPVGLVGVLHLGRPALRSRFGILAVSCLRLPGRPRAVAGRLRGAVGSRSTGTAGGDLQDHVDDLGLAGSRTRLRAERGGDGLELVAVFALERRTLQLLGIHAAHGTSLKTCTCRPRLLLTVPIDPRLARIERTLCC